MRRVITFFFATAGVIAGMVLLRRGPGSEQRRDHAQLVRRIHELHTEPRLVFEPIPALRTQAQWLIG